MALLHSSGGLIYHLRALRWRTTLWQPYRETVADWLDTWRPRHRRLVLIGPSAGYSLNRAFLARFDRIFLLEPDPLARWLLRRRFPGSRLENAGRLTDFPTLARDFPDAALLFCNLLGQTWRDAANDDWRAAFQDALADRAWASYHDLASTDRPPDRGGDFPCPRALPLDEVLAHYWQGGELEIMDHGTAGLCPRLPRRHALWHLTPDRFHLVEWLCHDGP